MNCTECQENLVAYLEDVLPEEEKQQVAAHLQSCPTCSDEASEHTRLRDRLLADGKALGSVPLDTCVMDRILREQTLKLRRMTMRKRYARAGLGLAAAAAIALAFFASWPGTRNGAVTAAEVMRQGVAALSHLRSVYIKVNMRTPPRDNFETVGPDFDFVPIEMWKEFGAVPKWRVEKPGRVAVMDGQSSLLFIKPGSDKQRGTAAQGGVHSGFVGFLLSLLDVDRVLESEVLLAGQQGTSPTLSYEQGADGSSRLVVTVEGKAAPVTEEQLKSAAALPDWLKIKILSSSDNRRVYRFDAASKRLEDVKVYLRSDQGDVLVLEVTEIAYNPEIAPETFALTLPEDVIWYQEPQVLPNNDFYAKMTPEEAARAFFQSCADENWEEALKFWSNSSFDDSFKGHMGGVQIISIGKPFHRLPFAAWFVPYEIKLKSGQTKKWNLAVRNDNPAKRWVVDGGI